MSETKAFLKSVHIENYLSLRDVTLPLKPLTVLVGPNASGKSNILSALDLLKAMMNDEKPPAVSEIQNLLWAGEANHIAFELHTQVGETSTEYQLELKAEAGNPFAAEELLVNGVKIISIRGGEGVVQDEGDNHKTRYRSNQLALKSAGDYGDKPVTKTLTGFIKAWEFYDFQPEFMRIYYDDVEENPLDELPEIRKSPRFDYFGFSLPEMLLDWHKNTPERFRNVSDSLEASTSFRIDQRSINGDNQLCLLEGYKNPIRLVQASDGTLRLIAYYTLLSRTKLPPLIAIEEPEHNMHPGALTEVAKILRQMADRSQVIITTHSSQLLDAFSAESLLDSLGVLFLRNVPGRGTEVLNLEDILEDEAALNGWITDFGIGSAIFDSGLINLMEEEPVCQL